VGAHLAVRARSAGRVSVATSVARGPRHPSTHSREYDLVLVERGEWDEEPEYPRAPLPAHERQWRHPSEQGAAAWTRSEPPLVVGRGLSVATGTVGAVLAIGLLWLMVPHSDRSGGGVAEVSSTLHAVAGGDTSAPRQTNLPLSIVSSSSVGSSSSQGNSNTIGSGTTSHTFAPTTASPVSNVATSPIEETSSSSGSDDSTEDTPLTSASSPSTAGTNTTPTTASGGGSALTSSTGAVTTTSTATVPSGPAISGPSTSTVPSSATTSAPTTSNPDGGSGGVVFAVALTDEHFVATTAAAVGGQESLNVQLPTGNTVVGDVVSVDTGSGIAVLSIPSDTPTTPIATSSASTSNTGAVVMTPEPTPATVFQGGSGTQITTGPDAHVGEGALVLDSAKRLIGLCTLGDDGVHVVGAQDLLAAINGAVADEPTPWLGLTVDPDTLAVTAVTAGGPAEAAGVLVGDVIAAIDGVPVTALDAISAGVHSHHPGETATLSVVRAPATDPVDVPVVLGANQGAL